MLKNGEKAVKNEIGRFAGLRHFEKCWKNSEKAVKNEIRRFAGLRHFEKCFPKTISIHKNSAYASTTIKRYYVFKPLH